MQIKIFTIPLADAERSEAEANKFLRSHRILQAERHFCPDGGGYWTLLAEYMDGDPAAEVPPANRRERRDVTIDLSEEERVRFDQLKVIRREVATQNAIPAYLVFTNEELATLARMPELTEETTHRVKGIAPQRLKDYIRVLRGGSWNNNATNCRVASRNNNTPTNRNNNNGFRLAL